MESYGTIWVCVCCMFRHANGECCADDQHGGDGVEPLSAIGEGFTVAMGMAYEDHDSTCERHPLECADCTDPATHAMWWQNEDGTREGVPSCGDPACVSVPCDAVVGGVVEIPTPFPVPDDYECDCETNTFSKSQCEGCGSWLYGERHAMTLFKEEPRSETPVPPMEDTPTLLRKLYDAARDA